MFVCGNKYIITSSNSCSLQWKELFDRQFCMTHSCMEIVLSKNINDKNCSVKEREEIFQWSVDIYLQKRCKTKTSIQEEPHPMRNKTTVETTKESNVGN